MNANNEKFYIYSKVKDKSFSPKSFENNSILNKYEEILKLKKDKDESKKSIIVKHPELGNLKINNEQEWNFLYQNNLINECIEKKYIKKNNSTRKILKIDFAKQSSENKIKYSDIISHLMNNISPDTYITHLLNFLNIRKDILNEFKLYIIDTFLNSQKSKEDNENLVIDNKEENVNKYIIETNKFFHILENKFNEIKKSYTSNNNTLQVLGKSESAGNDVEIKYDDEDTSQMSIFSQKNYSIGNFFKEDNIKGEQFFAIPSKTDYYSGIEDFKKDLRRLLINGNNNKNI